MEHTPTPWERSSRHIFSSGEDGANIMTTGGFGCAVVAKSNMMVMIK